MKLYTAAFLAPMLTRTRAKQWTRAGEQMALSLFHRAAVRVPAYKKFLKSHSIRHERVRSIADFKKLPTIDKKNYLAKYPLAELCWDGTLETASTVSVSTGSTGQPFFWPRAQEHIEETTALFELLFRRYFHIERIPTLFVVGYAMGMYVAGVYTTQCFTDIATRSKLVLVSPGLNADNILRIVKELSPQFQQLIIAGYPPFIKDVLERGKDEGVNWKHHKTKLIFGGEGFSESWREYVLGLMGSKTPHDAINLYGTADSAVLGHETALSIALRRASVKNEWLRHQLFGQTEAIPSLLQYYPFWRYFEAVDNELVFTANGAIPLLRYNIHDRGGIIPFDTAVSLLPESYRRPAKDVPPHLTWRLPFVYLFGRSDMTTTLYGLNIYPENILAALESRSALPFVTGRFRMTKVETRGHRQKLEITAELRPHTAPTKKLHTLLTNLIDATLMNVNAEYRTSRAALGRVSQPSVLLRPHGASEFQKTLKSLARPSRSL